MPAFDDDDRPRPKPTLLVPPKLDALAVTELEEYVAALEAEIGRVKAQIEAKKAVRAGAEFFFKKN
ncbi:MAG: DUF1192 domain-containing protein [Alphaproteobacteria bacterium]|nr:DUF1192 domain-containing protein [Alphaproteobacteria bacterium]